MTTKTTISNLKMTSAKPRQRPLGRPKLVKKPVPTGLASGITKKAIKVFKLGKKQQQEQAVAD